MKLIKICLFLVLDFFEANADRIVGNGGDLLKCLDKNTGKVEYELFDLYEARDLRKMSIQFPQNQSSFSAIATEVVERLSKLSPRRMKTYKQWIHSFEKEALFRKDVTLTNIDDLKHFYKPKSCNIEQVAIQLTNGFSEDPRYIIDEDLWLGMDNFQRAALVTHEVIYREYVIFYDSGGVKEVQLAGEHELLYKGQLKSFMGTLQFTKEGKILFY